MATWTYADSLRRLLVSEGGYSNHPADPGGPTNFGITIIDYRKYVKPDATAADVRGMKADQAKAIYRSKYWDAMRCDELPAGLDYAAFDYGVNSGIGRAGKVLRRMLHLPDNTSTITDEVISAARAADAKATIAALCDERLAFLKGLSTWPVFGRGWGGGWRRCERPRWRWRAMRQARRMHRRPHRERARSIPARPPATPPSAAPWLWAVRRRARVMAPG